MQTKQSVQGFFVRKIMKCFKLVCRKKEVGCTEYSEYVQIENESKYMHESS